jgi:hypothetical protein
MRVYSSSSLALACLAVTAATTTATTTNPTLTTTLTTTTTTVLEKASDAANDTLAAGDKVVEEWFIEPIHSRVSRESELCSMHTYIYIDFHS